MDSQVTKYDDRLIEDYLFGSYNLATSSKHDKDQQFAKPIEDEDIFGINCTEENTPRDTVTPSPELPTESQVEFDDDPMLITEQPAPSEQVTPPQPNISEFRAKFLERARKGIIQPKKIGTDFSDDGSVELIVDHGQMISTTDSKFLFNKFFNKTKKATDLQSPESNKRSWSVMKDSIRKRICSEKRKIWESFQQPVDDFNEEEELIEDARGEDVGEESRSEPEADAEDEGKDADKKDENEDAEAEPREDIDDSDDDLVGNNSDDDDDDDDDDDNCDDDFDEEDGFLDDEAVEINDKKTKSKRLEYDSEDDIFN